MPNRGSAVWTWNCKYTIIQRNECLHIRGYLDSHGIHIDHHNDHTYVQYNYMEDCEGGFVEILGVILPIPIIGILNFFSFKIPKSYN